MTTSISVNSITIGLKNTKTFFFFSKTAVFQTESIFAYKMKEFIVALDQGTTSCRSILFDRNAKIIASEQKEFTQIFPEKGWVEHNPIEIWGESKIT